MGRKLEAVIFDLDDTLVNWREAEALAVARLARERFQPNGVDPTAVAATYDQILAETMAGFRATGRWMAVRERLEILAHRHSLPVAADELAAAFMAAARAELRFLTGAVEAIEAARKAGLRTALLTNGPGAVQRPKVEHFRLEERLDFIGISGEMGKWKPDAAAFQHVLERLGASPEGALMVGDSLDFDIRPARKLGMRTAWIDAGGQPHPDAEWVCPHPGALVARLVAPNA
ncbi:MAG: HAD family hydrolase [Thermoplasmatota archaeon]